MTVSRRLAAILAVDVVGFSRLMEADEVATLELLKARRKHVLEPLIARHRGRLFKVTGDGVLIEFSSAVSAVALAIELQNAFAQANEKEPAGRHVILRIGINMGDVMAEGGDLYGEGVNIAARLEGVAEPGGIAVSGKVADEIRGKIAARQRDLGEQPLKNISYPVRVVMIEPGASAAATPATVAPIKREQTCVAVLPFTNLSGDTAQDFLADGLTEDIITELSRYHHLAVIARNSTFVYKGQAVDVRSVGRQLGADFVVEGSLRRSGEQVRATVQVIDVDTGAHVFAERFDRVFSDILAAQDELVAAILARFTFGLDEAASVQLQRRPKLHPSAYADFLQSRAVWRRGDEAKARGLLEIAIEKDPTYARALAYLGFFYAYARFSRSADLADAELVRRSRDLCQRAITADPKDSFTLHRAAMAHLMLGEPLIARRYAEAAAAVAPRELEVMQVRGIVTAFAGDHQKGLEYLEQAGKLERNLPPGFLVALSDVRYLAGDYQGALQALDSIAHLPSYLLVHRSAFLAQLGQMEEARKLLRQASGKFEAAHFARLCAEMCALGQDAEHWLEGFRKAGVPV